jgi:hypothetical protein
MTLLGLSRSAADICNLYSPKAGLCYFLTVCVSLLYTTPINLWMVEPVFMKLGMYIMAHESISATYFINPSHQSVCLYVYPPTVSGHWFRINVTSATNSHATIELLGTSFSMLSVSYKRKVGYWLFSELLVLVLLLCSKISTDLSDSPPFISNKIVLCVLKRAKLCKEASCCTGRAIAQAVSRWLPTARPGFDPVTACSPELCEKVSISPIIQSKPAL